MRVHTLERMKRLFFLTLAAAQFVFYLIDTWPPQAVRWIRELGGGKNWDWPTTLMAPSSSYGV